MDLITTGAESTDLAAVEAGGLGGGDYLPYIKLCSFNTEEVKHDKIDKGRYGLKQGDDITDLGAEMTALVIAVRPTATDFNGDEPVSDHDPNSDIYLATRRLADQRGNTGAVYGPEFLLYIPEVGFASYHLGNKSGRRAAPGLLKYLKDGNAIKPTFVTFSMDLITITKKEDGKANDYTFHVPVFSKYEGETPEDMCSQEAFDEQLETWRNPPKPQPSAQEPEDDRG